MSRLSRATVRAWSVCVAVCVATAVTPAQHHEKPESQGSVPASLRLKGDPGRTVELRGTTDAPSVTHRAMGGMVKDLGVVCRTCVEAGTTAMLPTQKTWADGLMLGADLTMIEPWLKRMAGVDPVILYTQRAAVACCLAPAKGDGMTQEDLDLLRDTFPRLKTIDDELDSHARAHLWLNRIRKLGDQFGALVDPQSKGWSTIDVEGGTREIRIEMFLFSRKEAHDAFVQRAFQPGTFPLSGALLPSGATGAVHLERGLSPQAWMRRVTFSTARQYARSWTRFRSTVPPFIEVGLAHYFELRPGSAHFDEAGTFPPDLKPPEDIDQFVADFVTAGKAADLTPLSQTPESGLSARSRAQAESLVRFLVGLGREKFGVFLDGIRNARANRPVELAFRDALKAAYGEDSVAVRGAWESWVRQP